MTVHVEFFGMARQHAGLKSLDVDADTIQTALQAVASACPRFAELCLVDNKLCTGYLLNHNGARFTSKLETPLKPGDSLLILSSDMGG